MEWNYYSLRVFSAVARRQNFTKAAKSLGLTQPAVTLQIQNLEKQIGCPLLIRKKTGGVLLTKAGEVVLNHSNKIFRLFEELQDALQAWTTARSQDVKVGCCCIAGEHIVPSYAVAFRAIRPQIELSYHVSRCSDIFERILDDSLAIGIAGVPARDRRLECVHFLDMPLYCFEAHRNDPRRISISDLAMRPMVLREQGSGTRLALQRFLEQAGLKFKQCRIAATSESNEAIKELVAKSIGWSILPLVVIEKELAQERFSLIELEEGNPIQEFFIVYRKHGLLSEPQREFVQLLLDEKSTPNPT